MTTANVPKAGFGSGVDTIQLSQICSKLCNIDIDRVSQLSCVTNKFLNQHGGVFFMKFIPFHIYILDVEMFEYKITFSSIIIKVVSLLNTLVVTELVCATGTLDQR